MKKKIILGLSAFIAVLALVFTANGAVASAAESEQETNTNLFTGFYPSELQIEGENAVSNLIKVEDNKQLLISMNIELDNTNGNYSNYKISSSLFIPLDSYFEKINALQNGFYYYEAFSNYRIDSSGLFVNCRILINISNLANKYPDMEYLMFIPTFQYRNDDTNVTVKQSVDTIKEVHVSFVDNGTITDKNSLLDYEVNYEPKTKAIIWSSDYSFDFSSDLVAANVAENTTIETVVSKINASSNGNKLNVISGSLITESSFEQGQTYLYMIYAEDSDGNYDSKLLIINVVDLEAPIIYGSNEYTIPNSTKLSINSIKSSLIVTDNVDAAEDIKLSLVSDYYSNNYKNPGKYYITFRAEDTSGNFSTFTVCIKVEDREAPKFKDENGLVIKSFNVHKSVDSVLLISEVIETLTATDNYDGNVDITVAKDSYSGNGDKPGTYVVKLQAKDAANNKSYFDVVINVTEEMPSKTIVINDRLIVVEKSVKLSKNDLVSIFKICENYVSTTTSYTVINDDIYRLSYNITGEYLVEYNITTVSGTEHEDVVTIRVVDSRSSGAIVTTPEAEEDGFIMKILKWIWNLILTVFTWIGNVFKGLFK